MKSHEARSKSRGRQLNDVRKTKTKLNKSANVAEIENDKEKSKIQSSAIMRASSLETIKTFSSTTPKRRKDPLAHLHSNLSPKYIGFSTPTSSSAKSGSPSETRKSRQRSHKRSDDNSSNAKTAESEMFFTSELIGCVRRTSDGGTGLKSPLSSSSSPSPSRKTQRFESPIEKLLRKNGAVNILASPPKSEDVFPSSSDSIKSDRKMLMGVTVSLHRLPHEELMQAVGGLFNTSQIEELQLQSTETEATNNDEEEKVDEILLEEVSPVNEEHKQHDEDVVDDDQVTEQQIEKSNFSVPSVFEEFSYNEPSYVTDAESLSVESHPDISSKQDDQNEDENFGRDEVTSVKSPSTVSIDSAKGSSIDTDGETASWVSISTGDLFWGQIFQYSYWPCMVCPDPEGKTISVDDTRQQSQHVLIHVRFFADNARRSWVRKENLLQYNGIDNFNKKMSEAQLKYGKKGAKYKVFVVSKSKKKLWNQGVTEADLINSTLQSERLQRFFEIYESNRIQNSIQRKRRQSLYIRSANSTYKSSTSDISSIFDSNDNLCVKPSLPIKRQRSPTPLSPAYSPLATKNTKKRKTEDIEQISAVTNSIVASNETNDAKNTAALGEDGNNDDTETIVKNTEIQDTEAIVKNTVIDGSLSIAKDTAIDDTLSIPKDTAIVDTVSVVKNTAIEEIYEDIEFQKFYSVMKNFIIDNSKDVTLQHQVMTGVRNLWALKYIRHRQADEVGWNTNTDSIKRLSQRLRNISMRRNMISTVTVTQSMTPVQQFLEKAKKPSGSINRPIDEVIDDIFELDDKYLFRGLAREPVCKYCHKPGGQLQKCAKNCQSWLHKACTANATVIASTTISPAVTNQDSQILPFVHVTADMSDAKHLTLDESKNESSNITHVALICDECLSGQAPKCFVCNRDDLELGDKARCNSAQCGKTFHPACLKYWPQAKLTMSASKIESLRCPAHVCHTCVSDDPKGKFLNISYSKLIKCVKCPATYHMDSTCIPAGSQIITASCIICPRHITYKADQLINVNWCFICVAGGKLICCETCPTAVHAECLKIPLNPEEGYICEECETGRMPLYGEMVWAKFTSFRWWPSIILPPTEIPENLQRKPHNPFEFVVRFFGTNDHGWISRRRVYLYQEGDCSEPPRNHKKGLDYNYTKGVEEAKRIVEIIKEKKLLRSSNDKKKRVSPLPYVKIKVNRAVPPIKLQVDLEKVSRCDCDKNSQNPCGPDSGCLNRVLFTECNPNFCPTGERCQNQLFESRIYPKLDVVYMNERGFGLVCREPISAGTFVIEYVGEVIDDAEFRRRIAQKELERDENFYFLSLEKDYIIDAGPKGNLARFMNHSCDPNCETQKWSINGLNRIGLFAIKDIPTNTELTFNYFWDELLGNEKKSCHCGASKCAGQIGGKYKEPAKKPSAQKASTSKRGRKPGTMKLKSTKLKLRATKTTAGKTVLKKSLKAKDTAYIKGKGLNSKLALKSTSVESAELLETIGEQIELHQETTTTEDEV